MSVEYSDFANEWREQVYLTEAEAWQAWIDDEQDSNDIAGFEDELRTTNSGMYYLDYQNA